MRLIDYRFSEFSDQVAENVSAKIGEFLVSSGEDELHVLHVDSQSANIVSVSKVDGYSIESLLTKAFAQSFTGIFEIDQPLVIRSIRSCRFIIFEDDGLIRICHCQDDKLIEFGASCVEVSDRSQLLVDTDLFDFGLR